jgi:hypothetical protein
VMRAQKLFSGSGRVNAEVIVFVMKRTRRLPKLVVNNKLSTQIQDYHRDVSPI